MRLAARPLVIALTLSACASYRILPLPADTARPAPLDYQSTRLFFFHANGSGAYLERLFVDPRAQDPLLATVLSPAPGVAASTDGGATWSFSKLPQDERLQPHILREVLFDPTDSKRLYARAFDGLLVSYDSGRSFQLTPIADQKGRPIDAFAVAPDGTLYVALGESLYASTDHAASFFQLPFEFPVVGVPSGKSGTPTAYAARVRFRSIVPDPTHTSTIYASVQTEPVSENFQRRLIGLLDVSTDEATQARALLALPADRPLDGASFGDFRAGVYVSRDGGRDWKKTSLGIDSWLVPYQGTIAAVAADPFLIAAGLIQRSPELAATVSAQLHEKHGSPEILRHSFDFPGREKLLARQPSSLIFQSTDQGASWSHLSNPALPLALALRSSVEEQRAAPNPWPPPPVVHLPEQHGDADENNPAAMQGRGGRGGRRRAARQPEAEPVAPLPDLTVPLLTLLDPAQILTRLGPDLPLTGISNLSGATRWAYAPTADYWAQLTDALIRSTRDQGELTLGGAAVPPSDRPAFELLRSDDGGQSWTALPAPENSQASYPAQIGAAAAQALLVIAAPDLAGVPQRLLLRVPLTAAAARP